MATKSYKFELYQDATREHRWRLVAANGRIVADSGEGYKTKAGAEKAVLAIQMAKLEVKKEPKTK